MVESSYFVVFLVNARHLDYSDNKSFFQTMAKHPNDGSKNSDVGHAWVFLRGIVDGQIVELEGGHSGETGLIQAKYFQGVMNNLEFGTPNPSYDSESQLIEVNPIKYLWDVQKDGYFQKGSGGHIPTFAAKKNITEQQFWDILCFIENYPFSNYSLRGNQCSTFVSQIASLANVEVDCQIEISINQYVDFCGDNISLWQDPYYSHIRISTPDVIEKSLIIAVEQQEVEDALIWYRDSHPESIADKMEKCFDNLRNLPKRLTRIWYFR